MYAVRKKVTPGHCTIEMSYLNESKFRIGNENMMLTILNIYNSTVKQNCPMKFGDRFSNLLGIKCTKFYLDWFGFDIFTVQCLGGYFFLDTVYGSDRRSSVNSCDAYCVISLAQFMCMLFVCIYV